MSKKAKIVVYILAIIIVLGVTGYIVMDSINSAPEPELTPSPPPMPSPTPIKEVIVQQEERIVEVEKEITSEIIQDGLNDVGILITEEYYFTDVISYSSAKKLWNHDVSFTESSYIATYDGVVTAGVDFSKISVTKDDEKNVIMISIPDATIQQIDIDPESFELHSEKTGLWNPISVEDFNDSLVELESGAADKAVERGVIDRANENAKTVIESFIASLIDTSVYSIQFESVE